MFRVSRLQKMLAKMGYSTSKFQRGCQRFARVLHTPSVVAAAIWKPIIGLWNWAIDYSKRFAGEVKAIPFIMAALLVLVPMAMLPILQWIGKTYGPPICYYALAVWYGYWLILSLLSLVVKWLEEKNR